MRLGDNNKTSNVARLAIGTLAGCLLQVALRQPTVVICGAIGIALAILLTRSLVGRLIALAVNTAILEYLERHRKISAVERAIWEQFLVQRFLRRMISGPENRMNVA